MRATLGWTLLAVEGGSWLLLVAASLHLLRLALWGLSQPRVTDGPALPSTPLPEDPPLVTVQLPIRNERDVAARLLEAVAALDWPRLEVQVLDDSDDETSAILDRAAAGLRARGLEVRIERRGTRAGFKAGNLQHGLATARGAFLLILDADSQPAPDLIRTLIAPLLADDRLAFAQARWTFVNERQSLLTRLQAIILSALFTVEQARLSAAKRPLQLNGTAALVRAGALKAVGGWLPGGDASVTEDLDLSYRVSLHGFRGETRPEIAVGTELPSTMSDFRAQQARWVRGAGEVLRGLGARLFAGSARDGVSMLAHLARHARQPLLLALAIGLPAAALGWITPARTLPHAWTIVLGLTLGAVIAYHAAALHRLGRSPAFALVTAPVVAALSVGLSFALTTALIAGLVGARGEFVRTPKRGDAGTPSYASPRAPRLVELLLGLANLAAAAWLVSHGAWLPAIPLAFFFAFGFLWVALG